MTPLALFDLAERLEAAAEYISSDYAAGVSALRLAADAVRLWVPKTPFEPM